MKYMIAPNHAETIEATNGEHTAAVLGLDEDGETSVISTHASIAEATEAVEALFAEAAEAEEPEAVSKTEAVIGLRVEGIEDLRETADLVERIDAGLSTLRLGPLSTGTEVIGQIVNGQIESFVTDESAAGILGTEFDALDPHDTEVSDAEFDSATNLANVASEKEDGAGYYAAIFAYADPEGDPNLASSYGFIHHFVNEAGEPGAASSSAVVDVIGLLNGGEGDCGLDEEGRQGVYDHVVGHESETVEYPELLSQEAYEAVLVAMGEAPVDPEDAEPEGDADDEGDAEEPEGDPAEVEEARSLADASDQEILDEMARRWAKDGEAPTEAADDEGESTEVVEAEEFTPEGEAAEGEQEAEAGEEPEVLAEGDEEDGGSDDGPNPNSTTTAYDWEAVLIVEDLPSGDGRMIADGILTWRELPIPLMSQTVNAMGHEGAKVAGSIHDIERVGNEIVGRGYFDSGEAGQELARLIGEKTMRGVSADVDSVVTEFRTPEGKEVDIEAVIFGDVEAFEVLIEGRIMGATATPFPAFQEAHMWLTANDDLPEALVASGAVGDVWTISGGGLYAPGQRDEAAKGVVALIASGAAPEVPSNPPRSWFEPGEMAEPEPFTVHPDGRCYGLVAQWGTCHIGFSDRCQDVPRSGNAYRAFRNKNVLTAEGDLVATGPIFMDTVHPNLRLAASDAQAHYADTGCAVADVALYENEHGIVAAGALRPGLSPEQMRAFRGSDVSPDWRMLKGRLEVVALLSVNCSGFIVDGLVASGGGAEPTARGLYDSVKGEVTALVAAGMVHGGAEQMLSDRVDELTETVERLSAQLRPIVAERLRARFTAAGGALVTDDAEEASVEGAGDCGCDEGDQAACSCEV